MTDAKVIDLRTERALKLARDALARAEQAMGGYRPPPAARVVWLADRRGGKAVSDGGA
jgi:hypothetical protein